MISATRLSRQIFMSPLSLLLIFIFFLQGKTSLHKIIRPTCSSPLSVFIDASLILSPLSCRSPDLFHKCPHIFQPSAPIFRSIGDTALSMAPRRRDVCRHSEVHIMCVLDKFETLVVWEKCAKENIAAH